MSFQDNSIILNNSQIKMAFKKWGDGPEIVLALHGWLDNCASFDLMGPLLDKRFSFYALDLCGHGLSDHLPPSGDYTIVDAIEQILEFTKQMNFESFHLVGHSMGAGISSLVAGVIPRRIKTLTLIEGIGPISSEKDDLPQRILKHFKIKFRKLVTQKPLYKDLEEAALDRHIKTELPLEASRLLAKRGLVEKSTAQFTWRTDSRLLAPTAHPLSEEEVLIFLRKITAKTTLILGSTSRLNEYTNLEKRAKATPHCHVKTMDGGHHIHMEVPREIAALLNK